MQKFIPFALAATLAISGTINAEPAYTKPSGYVTESLKAGQFNLFALTVQKPQIASGLLSSVTTSQVSDSEKDFNLLLTPGKTYVLEISDPTSTASGAIVEVNAWSGSNLTTSPTDLTLIGATSGVGYTLRESNTIGELFGSSNQFGLLAGTLTTADILWIANGGGSFNRYYYANAIPPFVTAGWKLIGGGNTDRANTPIVYTDALILQRRGVTTLPLVIAGQVKTTPSIVVLSGNSFNHIGTTFPVGSTLHSSGIEATILKGSLTTGDIVWVPDEGAGYKRYYFANAQPPFVTVGWKLIGGGNTDRANDIIKSGIIIQRRGVTTNLKITPPAFYSNL